MLGPMSALSGQGVRQALEGLGELALLAREVVRALFSRQMSADDLREQLYFIGVKSQSVVFITGAFTGLVLCALRWRWSASPCAVNWVRCSPP